MKRGNRKQRRRLIFAARDAKTGQFKVISKAGAVITLIEVNLPPKRMKNLGVGKAKLEKVH